MISADVLVLGGGPAGLAAATSLSRLMIPAIIFDSGAYRNAPTSHMHNVIGFDHVHPADFRATARKTLTSRYKTNSFVDSQVISLKKTAAGTFEAKDARNQEYSAKKIILATGVRDLLPKIQGFESVWGNTAFHCLFCHGFEECGSKKAALLAEGLLANPAFTLAISGMASRLADDVVVYTNGNEEVKMDIEKALATSVLHVTVDARTITRLDKLEQSSDQRLAVHFANGESEELGFMVHVPAFEVNVPKEWREELGVELNDMGDLKVNQKQQTTCPGIFAAGDHSGMMKAVPQALFTGSTAAGFVVHELVLGL